MTKVKPVESWARLSSCERYRYALGRIWDRKLDAVMFVGLNPSTADQTNDDPTVRRCVQFASGWGFGSVILTNLFGYRSKDPRDLCEIDDPVGPENDDWLAYYANKAELVVVAWGARGDLMERDAEVLSLLRDTKCLGTTKNGAPRHPLYLANGTTLRPYSG